MAGKGSHLQKIKYTPSDALAEIVGAKPISRPDVTKKLWAYIKEEGLQDKKNKRTIVPDAVLGAVLGKKPLDMMKMGGKLSDHLEKIED